MLTTTEPRSAFGDIHDQAGTHASQYARQPPLNYTLQVEGSGGPGFVKGTAKITLEPSGDSTSVKVDGDGQVGGMLAGVGQRMLPGVAKMLMNQFFECLINKSKVLAA